MPSDQHVILFGRGTRSFAVGAFVVALPLALAAHGFSAFQLNVVLSAGLAGATLQMQYVTRLSQYFGRFYTLAICTIMFAIAGGVLATVHDFYLVVFAVFMFSFSVQPNVSSMAPIEQATLADTANQGSTQIFAMYNGISTIAIAAGNFAIACTSSLGSDLQILLTSLLLLVVVVLYSLHPTQAEAAGKEALLLKVDEDPEHQDAPIDLALTDCPHLRRIVALGLLFGVDSFAGGMTLNSVIIHWMVSKYHVSESIIGTIFGFCNIIAAPSLWVAAWLGDRIGLINTMVFTHLPSNFGLVALPFMETANGVYAVLIFRALLSQMDVPARDAFMMNVVDKSERVACSSCINAVRGIAAFLGPVFSGALATFYGTSVPLVLAGLLKSAYDITLFITCRSMRVDGAK